ncbi:TVP38/TMEM64 family protein [Bacillus sp. 165]|uniref:TVP38/TMEM64 family protein n=1 Tax=Bacillus sp. 165 TaxID=1529117 RepID=UPI001ADA2B1B|nr:TVP38/TMEM64 family protein [Bacillus sp. 165]MBO9128707.1 TVP38/TMEM64 family protein [Bacillus sp. 165]
MDLHAIKEYMTIENIQELLRSYRAFGPLFGISLTLVEAFVPVLPLFAFVMANAAAYGLWAGFFYSWLGSCIGALLLCLIVRKYGRHRFFSFLNKHPKVRQSMRWIERKGFGPIFILYCFPFTPSALINVVAGLSRVSMKQFMLALMLGKVVMVLMISYVGFDALALIHKPIRTIIAVGGIFLLWYVGKRIEIRLELHKK